MTPVLQIALLFALTFTLLGLALTPALIEWWRKTDAEPLRVVREQDMSIRHFALSFRTQINTLFDEHAIEIHDPPPPFDTAWHDDEPVSFLGNNPYPEFSPEEIRSRRIDRVLVATGDLLLPGDMVYEEEVYCCGNLMTGDRTAYRAVYAERAVVLGEEAVIVRWAHCDGDLTVGASSQLLGRLSADQSVTLGRGCEFERVSAPVIRFASNRPGAVPPRANESRVDWNMPEKLQTIDDQTLKSTGTLSIESNAQVQKNLIVKTELAIGENVKVEGAIKAVKHLKIGANCVIHGALVCEGSIEIGPGCVIKGPIVSESSIEIAAGCVIGAPSKPTTVSAPAIEVEPGAQISGLLWAGTLGLVAA